MKRRAAILGMGLVLTAGTGLAQTVAAPPSARPKFCAALDDFGAAPPDGQQVTFFWREEADSDFDLYAAMTAAPMDDRAHRLYSAYAPVTHTLPLTDLKTRLDRCASVRAGRVLLEASHAACHASSSQECLKIVRSARR